MVTACGASALAWSPMVARPARGGGAGEVSTRGLRERRRTMFRGGVLIEAMTHRWGGIGNWQRRRLGAGVGVA
jgi:hypothetical protein